MKTFRLANFNQYPVITASEPLSKRYMSSQGSLGFASSSRSITEHLRRSPQPDQPIVVASKKKKQKKKQEPAERSGSASSPERAESGPSTKTQSTVPRSAAAPATPAEPEQIPDAQQQHKNKETESPNLKDAIASPWAESEQEDNFNKNFRIGDAEEFKNVWGGGESH